MVDKSIKFYVNQISNGADVLWDYTVGIALVENLYGPGSITIQNCSGYVDIVGGAQKKAYYIIVGVTDGSGSYPLDSTTMGLITTDAELRTFLEDKRKSIWMTMGGICAATADEGNPLKIEMDAGSKRVLRDGQKLMLVVLTRNLTTSTADSDGRLSVDFTTFYG